MQEMGDEVERRKEDDAVRALRGDDEREKDDDHSLVPLLPGIPLAPSSRDPKPPRVIFVLEKASLVPAYVGRVRKLVLLPIFSLARIFCVIYICLPFFCFCPPYLHTYHVLQSYQILNPDEHADFLRKKNMNPYDHRPDIIHEVNNYPFVD